MTIQTLVTNIGLHFIRNHHFSLGSYFPCSIVMLFKDANNTKNIFVLSIIYQPRLCLALRITKLKNPKFRGRIYSVKLQKLTSHPMKAFPPILITTPVKVERASLIGESLRLARWRRLGGDCLFGIVSVEIFSVEIV